MKNGENNRKSATLCAAEHKEISEQPANYLNEIKNV